MFNTSLSRLQRQISEVEEQAITGVKLIHPSDIPTAIAEAHDLRASIDDQELFIENGNRALSFQNQAEQTLSSASEIMKRAWEVSILAASDTLDDVTRQLHAEEVADLELQLQDLANTQFEGRYLFSGLATDTPAYDANGVYQGSADGSTIQIGDGSSAQVSYDGSAIFDPLFATLSDLHDAIIVNDTDAIGAMVDDLQGGVDHAIQHRSMIGLDFNATSSQVLLAENLEVTLAERLNGLIGADPIETYNQLAALRSSYESALQVAGTSLQTSLMDYVR